MNKELLILIAEDDPDDRLLLKEAFESVRIRNPIDFVTNGEELLDYLYNIKIPGIILLDLNMPKVDGRDALKLIKNVKQFKAIPIIILTTSKDEIDIFESYNLGAAGYIIKPNVFESLVDVMKSLGHYWFEIVKLPKKIGV